MVRFHLVILALLTACGSSGTVAKTTSSEALTAEPSTGEWELDPNVSARLFGNDDGVRVELVAVRSTTNPELRNRYLLRATGTTSKFDGLVIVAQRERRNKTLMFDGTLRGQPNLLLSHDTGRSSWAFRGYATTNLDDEIVYPLEDSVDGAKVLALREGQRGSALRAIEPQTREEKVQWQQRYVEEYLAELPEDCSGFRFSVDWSSVPDEAFDLHTISGICSTPISIIQRFCEQNPKQGKAVGDSLSVECSYRDGHDERKSQWEFRKNSDGSFTYVPGGEAREAHIAIVDILRKKFGAERKVFRLGTQHFIIDYKLGRASSYYQHGNSYWPAGSTVDSDPKGFRLPSGAVSSRLDRSGDQHWGLLCGQKMNALEELETSERDAILKNAKFEPEPKWKREPYFLSRDSHGTYYYVDRYQQEFGGKRYRVFVGRRGQLKITKLKRLVEDSEGTLFSTESGDLRLVVSSGDQRAVWIHGRKETRLTPVNVRANLGLIYDELGVYYGDELGFVCD